MSGTAPGQLGQLVRRFRLAAAFSQEELADRSSVSVRTISDLERGARETARLETVRLLAESLELTPADREMLIGAATAGIADHAPLRHGDDVRSNLPEPPNPLIGRSTLVEAIVSLVKQDRVRVLTLTGPGGVGKTRVAIEAASQLAAQMDIPAVFVPLATVSDAALVPVAAAHALGASTGSASPEEQVVRHLSRRTMLLVLDNLEHVLDAASFIARLGEEAQGVSILATSRARLHISCEQEFPIPPLALPDARAGDDEIRGAGSVRLFSERAAAATGQPGALREQTVIVAEICRRLEGLPLGLELAASRLRVMSPSTLLAMLDSRLPVLTGGNRDQPLRHQSMRATIGWSYELLDPHAKTLFRWLAVYVDGFTSEAAAHTGSAIGRDPVETFDSLERLLESSLVERIVDGDEEPRFRMLETIREYGIEQLRDHGEQVDAHMAYAWFIYEVVADGAPLPGGELDPAWFARVEREDANVMAVFDWLCHAERAELAVAFCAVIGMYWEYRGPWRVVAARMRRAMSLAPLVPSLATTRALYFTAGFLMGAGEYAVARDLGDTALRMSRDLGDRRAVAYSLGTLGWNAELQEAWSEASKYFEQALSIWQELGERGTQGQMLMFLGGHAYVKGDYVEARRLQEAAASIFRGSATAVDFLAVTEQRLGCIDAAERRWDDAAARALRSLELWLTTLSQSYIFQPMILIADAAAAIGEFEVAATFLGCCDHQLDTIGGALFSIDRNSWERATERSREALGFERFTELHCAARGLGPVDWLRLGERVVVAACERTH